MTTAHKSKPTKAPKAITKKPAAGTPKAGKDATPSPSSGATAIGSKAQPHSTAKATTPATKPLREKRMSALDAAARVLATSDKPMRCTELIAEMQNRSLWTSPSGKTPESTLHAAITREIATKGDAARFKKVDRGLFGPGKGN
jgi:hypothetical protein